MTKLTWDQVGTRVFQNGLDRGVLYLAEGAVPWNGLRSVTETSEKSTTPIYYDGVKINDIVDVGDFSAVLKAITYPDEFLELEGTAPFTSGGYLGDQPPKTFGLSYRTRIGNDLDSDPVGYKIHVLYNLTAIPGSTQFDSVAGDANSVEFEWKLSAVPVQIDGFFPTAHVILDTRDLDATALSIFEANFYGDDTHAPMMLPLDELMEIAGLLVRIIDNGDGTWTARSFRNGFITDYGNGTFELANVSGAFLNANAYEVSDTSI